MGVNMKEGDQVKTLTDLWLEGRKKPKTVIEDKPEEKPVKKTTRKKSTAKADTEKEGE